MSRKGTFRRWRDRYEAEGRPTVSTTAAWAACTSARRTHGGRGGARCWSWFDTRYPDFTAKHFHEKLVADHGFKRSYNWLRLSLQAHGQQARVRPLRGAHRRKRAAPCPARHDVAPGRLELTSGSPVRWWDLIVTIDDATSDIYKGRSSSPKRAPCRASRGCPTAIRAKGAVTARSTPDRASHYWNDAEAGGKVDKDTPTQVGRAFGAARASS